MLRYVPRLDPAGTAPRDALVEPLIENPPARREHELIPDVAWMVERDGAFVDVPAAARAELEMMRGSSIVFRLIGTTMNDVEITPPSYFSDVAAHAAMKGAGWWSQKARYQIGTPAVRFQ